MKTSDIAGAQTLGPLRLNGRPYLIAEMCNNHGGLFHVANRMLHSAVESRASVIKWQLRLKPGRVSSSDLGVLLTIQRSLGVISMVTAFETAGVDIVADELKPDLMKIGSAEVVNKDFVHYVLQKGIPTIISTGGCRYGDIAEVVEIAKEVGTPFGLAHCTSIYPTPYDKVNLGCIPEMARLFKCPVGLSCHTKTIYTGIAAVALGAPYVEKHFMLDGAPEGPDTDSSLTPFKFRQLAIGMDAVWESLGNEKDYWPEEREKLEAMRA